MAVSSERRQLVDRRQRDRRARLAAIQEDHDELEQMARKTAARPGDGRIDIATPPITPAMRLRFPVKPRGEFHRTPLKTLGDLFALFPDLPWPRRAATTNVALASFAELVRTNRAAAQETRERGAAVVTRHRIDSEHRRAASRRRVFRKK